MNSLKVSMQSWMPQSRKQTEMLNGGKLYEDYQEVCIKNSKLNATVDVLVEKISMLKAVGCHG